MDRSGRLNPTQKLVLDALVFALGVIFTLDNLGVMDSGDITFAFWGGIEILRS